MLAVRRLLFLGTQEGGVMSEYMNIICRAGEEETVIRRLIEFILKEDLCDDFCLLNIDASSVTLQLLKQIARDRRFLIASRDNFKCPYVTLPKDYEEFLRQCSVSLRHNIKSVQRKLLRHNNIAYRKTTDIFELEEDLNELVRLHQLRWESRNLPGSFSGGKFLKFQKLVTSDMLKNGHLELRFLSISGRNIAAVYNIKYQNKIYYFQSGLDVSFDKELSPGLLIHNYSIEEAIKAGLKEYDFLLKGDTDAYKERWTKEFRYVCDLYMARPGVTKFVMSVENKAKTCYDAITKYRMATDDRGPNRWMLGV